MVFSSDGYSGVGGAAQLLPINAVGPVSSRRHSSIANFYLDELKTFHAQRAATMGFEGLAGFAETYGRFQIDRD